MWYVHVLVDVGVAATWVVIEDFGHAWSGRTARPSGSAGHQLKTHLEKKGISTLSFCDW